MPTLPTTYRTAQKRKLTNQRKYREQNRRALKTNSKLWRGIRARHLASEPLCRHCQDEGTITPATEVDHIDGDSWNNDETNFQSLCKKHHSIKTAKEVGFRSKADGPLRNP